MTQIIEEFRDIDEFPEYGVSNLGNVVSDYTGRILRPSSNQLGIYSVGISKDHVQYRRSVAVLVANAFLPKPASPHFDTPIHRDGDKSNCRADNLIYRPRWFAVKYHQQFTNQNPIYIPRPIYEVKTGLVFDTSWDAARHYGLLDKDIFLAILNNTVTPVTYQEFRELE